MEYKQKLLEDENTNLRMDVKNIHQELTELKRIINLLGDSLSYDNQLLKNHDDACHSSNVVLSRDNKRTYNNFFEGSSRTHPGHGYISLPAKGSRTRGFKNIKHPFLTKDVINKLSPMAFVDFIKKHNLNYDISKDGYNWKLLCSMCTDRNIESCYSIVDYIGENYELTWESFKELYEITISAIIVKCK